MCYVKHTAVPIAVIIELIWNVLCETQSSPYCCYYGVDIECVM